MGERAIWLHKEIELRLGNKMSDDDIKDLKHHILALFQRLPLAALIGKRILCVHGGPGSCQDIEGDWRYQLPFTYDVRVFEREAQEFLSSNFLILSQEYRKYHSFIPQEYHSNTSSLMHTETITENLSRASRSNTGTLHGPEQQDTTQGRGLALERSHQYLRSHQGQGWNSRRIDGWWRLQRSQKQWYLFRSRRRRTFVDETILIWSYVHMNVVNDGMKVFAEVVSWHCSVHPNVGHENAGAIAEITRHLQIQFKSTQCYR